MDYSSITLSKQQSVSKQFSLPSGIDTSKFDLYEVKESSKDYRDIQGGNAVLAVHGPPDKITSGGKVHEGGGGGIFAVIATSGTQFKVTAGDILYTNRMCGEVNSQVWFDDVLVIGTVEWSLFGRPVVRGAKVLATIEEQTKSAKVMVTKFKKRKGYRRRQGHRQPITRFRIDRVEWEMPGEESICKYELPVDGRRPNLPNSRRRW